MKHPCITPQIKKSPYFALFSPCEAISIIADSTKKPYLFAYPQSDFTLEEFRSELRRLLAHKIRAIYVDADYRLPTEELQRIETEVNIPIIVFSNYTIKTKP